MIGQYHESEKIMAHCPNCTPDLDQMATDYGENQPTLPHPTFARSPALETTDAVLYRRLGHWEVRYSDGTKICYHWASNSSSSDRFELMREALARMENKTQPKGY